MGLDFSTGGLEGMEIKAAKQGTIFQVRSSLEGYGNAIYIRHKNGYVTVYGHLAKFSPKLAVHIRSLNIDPETNFGRLDLALPVNQGELIAWSGESGAGMPHLHFEVRDSENRPVHPCNLDFPNIADRFGKPELQAFILLPADETALINGKNAPFLADPGQIIAGQGNIHVLAAAGLKGHRGGVIGAKSIGLTANGNLVRRWTADRISFDDYRSAGSIFNGYYSGFGPTHFFYRLEPEPNKNLPGLESGNPGLLNIQNETQLEVEISDFYGRTERFGLTLSPNAPHLPQQHPQGPAVQATTLTLNPVGKQLLIETHDAGTLSSHQGMTGLAEAAQKAFTVAPGPQTLVWRTANGSLKRSYSLLKAEQLELDAWQINGHPQDPEQAIVLLPADQRQQESELSYRSPVLMFGRPGLPSAGLTLRYPHEDKPVWLFEWSYVKRRWVPASCDKEGPLLTHQVRYFTPIVAAEDTSPPQIMPPGEHAYFIGKRTVIPIRERGSGIDSDSVQIESDNQKIEAYYDSDRRWIVLGKRLSKGTALKVRIQDRAGNSAQTTLTI